MQFEVDTLLIGGWNDDSGIEEESYDASDLIGHKLIQYHSEVFLLITKHAHTVYSIYKYTLDI